MGMTDPIADMLTRIRNANGVKQQEVSMPTSRLKEEIARILKEEGYIREYRVIQEEGKKPMLKIVLKYGEDRERVIHGIKRISKPGLRVYAKKDEIPKVLGGLGIAVLSTSKGVVSDKQARKDGVGGEVICYVW
jgi:small subunit ribosomal protein S8